MTKKVKKSSKKLPKKFCSLKICCTFALAFDKECSSLESNTILENIPYRHSSTAVFEIFASFPRGVKIERRYINCTGTKNEPSI